MGDYIPSKVWTIKRNMGKSDRWGPKGSEDVLTGIELIKDGGTQWEVEIY